METLNYYFRVLTAIQRSSARLFWLLHAAFAIALLYVPFNAIVRAIPYLATAGDPADPHDVGFRRWPSLLLNTLIVDASAVGICVSCGTLLGSLSARLEFRLRDWLHYLLLMGACVPSFVAATVVFAMTPPWALPPSPWVAGLFHGILLTPISALIIGAALRRSNRALDELALLDTGPLRALFFASLPGIRGTFVSLALFSTILVTTDCTLTDLLRVRTFAEEVYTQFALRRSPAGPLLTGLPVTLACAALLLLGRSHWASVSIHSEAGVDWRAPPIRLNRAASVLLNLCVILLTAMLAIPGAALVAKTQSFEHFGKSLSGFRRELENSFAFCAISALLLVIVGAGIATAATRKRWVAPLVALLVASLIAMPAPLAGISLIDLLNHPGWRGHLYDSPAKIAIGFCVRFLPVAILLLAPAIGRISRELDWQVRLDGGNLLTVHGSVVRPLIAREAGCTFLIIFLLCFSEVPCTILLCPPGVELASVRAFSLLHFGVYADWAALAIASGVVSLAAAGLLRLFQQRIINEGNL